MKGSIAVGWLAGLALGLIAAPLAAQTTTQRAAEILSGPDAGRPAPGRVTTVIVPQREVIVVERVRGKHGWWKKRGYRVITVYYDGRRFYRRPFARAALRRVVVYERAGRYYVDEDHWKRKHRHHDRDDDRKRDDD
jgi:hypothetical protein